MRPPLSGSLGSPGMTLGEISQLATLTRMDPLAHLVRHLARIFTWRISICQDFLLGIHRYLTVCNVQSHLISRGGHRQLANIWTLGVLSSGKSRNAKWTSPSQIYLKSKPDY